MTIKRGPILSVLLLFLHSSQTMRPLVACPGQTAPTTCLGTALDIGVPKFDGSRDHG